jgi:hypothetical protein
MEWRAQLFSFLLCCPNILYLINLVFAAAQLGLQADRKELERSPERKLLFFGGENVWNSSERTSQFLLIMFNLICPGGKVLEVRMHISRAVSSRENVCSLSLTSYVQKVLE